jgi:hypothetical protein
MRHLGYTAAVLAALAAAGPAAAQAPATMQPGQRLQLGPMMGDRVVRQVMVGENGDGIVIVYDNPAGQPQSRRVLRLENVNGMLEVVYDTAMPSTMALGTGGRPRIVPGGDGMYSVEYDR